MLGGLLPLHSMSDLTDGQASPNAHLPVLLRCTRTLALSHTLPVLPVVMTHDSIGLGEDGPTHQPIEHLASFRAMPNMLMIRPAGGNEVAGAYKVRTGLLVET